MLGGSPARVLIADDDPAILDALQIMLEDEGYEVAAIGGGDVVRETERIRPDVILLDIRMSGQDGREICRALKHHDTAKQTPVIMVSANRDGAVIAHDAGADAFIAKPFDIDDLLTLIATYAGRGAVR
ncbi:MAG: response regulator [Thermomicrobiales bacterium]|nr:response regulator [Thermomicrobiales bacterium]